MPKTLKTLYYIVNSQEDLNLPKFYHIISWFATNFAVGAVKDLVQERSNPPLYTTTLLKGFVTVQNPKMSEFQVVDPTLNPILINVGL